MSESRLTRSETDRMIAGICGGLAAYLGIDTVLVRALFVILIFASGIGFPIYLMLWFIIPRTEAVGKSNADVIQDNIEEMGQTVSAGMNRIGRPGAVGTALVFLGSYFLLREVGLLSWLHGGLFWPIMLIGLGIFLLVRRAQ